MSAYPPERRAAMAAERRTWTDEEREIVAGMLRKKMSGGKIAKHFGISRNAAISRIRRDNMLGALGLPGNKGGGRKKTNVIAFPKVTHRNTHNPTPKKEKSAPLLKVVNNTALMIADYLAKHGARRFQNGETVDYGSLQMWLRDRGIGLSCLRGVYHVSTGGRPRTMRWRDVVTFVDTLRAKEGLQPICRASA